MPQKAKSLDDLINIISKYKKDKPAAEVAKDMLNQGSGSIILDSVSGLIKKAPKGEKITKGFGHIQSKLNDIDIKAGNKIHEVLNNGGPTNKKIGKAFLYTHDVPLKSVKGKPDRSIKIDVPMASAPVENLKRVALPVAGSLFVADKIMSKDKDGDTVKAADISRDNLIEKIANHISGSSETDKPSNSDFTKQASTSSELLFKASKMLKFAADERKQLLVDMEKLASENKELHRQIVVKEKLENATKLAKEMNEKGMVKTSDVQSKIAEIMTLDDDAYRLLKTATENVKVKLEKNAFDNLTFLDEDYNIKDIKRKTLADEIESSI